MHECIGNAFIFYFLLFRTAGQLETILGRITHSFYMSSNALLNIYDQLHL